MNKTIGWAVELATFGCDISCGSATGVSLLGKFSQTFYNTYLEKRFETFCHTAEINEELIRKVSENEEYSNCFYASLETIRQTHSQLGIKALALIYKDYWNNPDFLIPAMRSFNQVSNVTLMVFIDLYEHIDKKTNCLNLTIIEGQKKQFHKKYNEAVELIHRNFFVQSVSASMHANAPMQGMKMPHTDEYYKYCILAKKMYQKS